jgi:DNA-binding PadR family transcriptional regulator
MGRKLASAELQLLMLRLLADEPHHGYQIIKALDERSNGFYVPSPGMVYPALTHLEDLGHALVQTDANRKRYHITDAGRRHLEEHRPATDALIAQFERVADRMERVRHALNAEQGANEPETRPQRRGSKDLLRARHDLDLALAGQWDGPREQQQRIVEILQRAAADIAAKQPRR